MKKIEGNKTEFINIILLIIIMILTFSSFNNTSEVKKEIEAQFYDTPEIIKLKLECTEFIQNMSKSIVFIQDIDIQENKGNIICHSVVGFNCTANIGHKKSYTTNITYPYIKYACPDIMYYKVKMNEYVDAMENCYITDSKFTINITPYD